jgi:membrane-bound lytic murein transglycosylase A
MRIGFAAKSGHQYTSIGRLAVERGLLPRERADKDGLEAWLKANRAAGVALMRENRSFIFFRELEDLGDADGPLGAAGVPLTAGRSLAVDRTLMTFHMPVFVSAPALPDLAAPERAFRRLMIAQDTGSAILGPARGDIFVGSGSAAGSLAGRIRHKARMVVLAPRQTASPS